MTVAATERASAARRYISAPNPSGLADVLDLILDKGLVVDVYVRVSLVGIEVLTIDARIVVASVDTYLRFAEAVNRLDLTETEVHGIPELIEEVTRAGARGTTKGALEGVKNALEEIFSHNEDDERPPSRSANTRALQGVRARLEAIIRRDEDDANAGALRGVRKRLEEVIRRNEDDTQPPSRSVIMRAARGVKERLEEVIGGGG